MTSVMDCDLELWAEGNSFFPKVAFGHRVCQNNRNKTRIKVTISLVFLCLVITIISHKSQCPRAGEVVLSGGNEQVCITDFCHIGGCQTRRTV